MIIKLVDKEDVSEIGQIYISCWQTTYYNLVPKTYLDNLSLEDAINKWTNFFTEKHNSFIYAVINDKNQYIGFVAGLINQDNPTQGELYALYLLEGYQGLGLGKQLFMSVVKHFINYNINSMIVWVMKENKNGIKFYEHMNGKLYQQRKNNFGNYIVDDVAYQWLDLASLI